MELGKMHVPKPLLSGYFTNQLNSVQNVAEVQKSLEDTEDLDKLKDEAAENNNIINDHGIELRRGSEEGENVKSEMQTRPKLKIKQSLTRDFSIQSLKRAAGQLTEKKHVRTPSERQNTIENASKMLIDKSRTPFN